ncbi:MAG: hypothetical protein KatS3mg105_0938 [Gemmatales bacterium]|nr:MAG: hypothetical protein KatS3mg105_0938 [Gemmatales bacterium]
MSTLSTKTRQGKSAIPRTPRQFNYTSESLTSLTQIFKLLADESRLRILLALADEPELNVSSLCQILQQTQPAVSHHLTLLRMTGLVGYRRDGKHNYYRLESTLVRDLLDQFFTDSGNGHKLLHLEDRQPGIKRK